MLENKSILITGSASGMGKQTALLAAQRGALVTVADINGQAAEAVSKMINDNGGRSQYVIADIADESQVAAMVDAVVSAYGRIDGAFNNAAVPNKNCPFHELPTDEFKRHIDINLVGTFLCMKYEIRAMLESGGGAIVNTSSCAGILGLENAADYVSSKHGVIGLTKSAALDYATKGIRVNAVLPGLTKTPMLEKAFAENEGLEEWMSEKQPVKRMGKPEEIAEAALWLLSDAASFVVGTSMTVDGGYSIE